MCIMEMNENEPLMTLRKAQMLSKLYRNACIGRVQKKSA